MNSAVPVGWEVRLLGSLVDPRSSNVDKKTVDGELPVRLCNYTDVYYNNRITNQIDFMEATAKEREIERFQLEVGDVIITKDSETPGDIAVPAFVAEPLDGVVCGYHLTLLKPKQCSAEGEYLAHLFQLPSVGHHFYILANGITRFGLTAEAIANAPLLAPPLPEQQKIAAILSSVDDVIEKTQAQIDKLSDLKTGMMQELLTKGIGHTEFKRLPKWVTGKIAEIDKIPSSWELVNIGSVAKLESGHTPSRDNSNYWGGEFQWISLHDTKRLDTPVIEATTLTITQEGLDNSSARLLPAGTVAFSRTASVGHCVIFGKEMATSQDFANYVCGSQLNNRYLLHLFRWMQHVWDNLAEGSTHKTIYMPIFKKLQILLPPTDEQDRIASIADGIDDKISQLTKKYLAITHVKKALMQDLLTGKVRVSVD